MPELPEVETFRKKIESVVRNKKIEEVEVHPDSVVFEKKGPATIKKNLLQKKVKKCCRKGKYIWFEMEERPWPVFHLGMTGSYTISDHPPGTEVKSVKLVLKMSNGKYLIFRDPRRFGRVLIKKNPLEELPLKRLGPDVMNDLPEVNELYEQLQKKKTPIKAALLDQTFLSGIGNWMADEILYQSNISPHHKANELSKTEIRKLHAKIKHVTDLSVNVEADAEKYPKSWLFHHRWQKKKGKVSTGEEIKHDVVGGRSTAWVPEKQF